MDFLSLVNFASGAALATFALNAIDGNWKELWQIAKFGAIPNGLTLLLVVLYFWERDWEEAGFDRILLICSYMAGMAVGVYFYCT